MTYGSLFSGIGGIDLGFERAGLTCKWQVEIDEYCRHVLAKYWPDVPKHDDVQTFPPTGGDWSVDVICGGFPCQDISTANLYAEGIDGKRSGLWREFVRIIGILRPRFVVVENVRALLVRGFFRVLEDLARLRYDAEWQIISAAALGAPHIRERIFIIAYLTDSRRRKRIFSKTRMQDILSRQRLSAITDINGIGNRWIKEKNRGNCEKTNNISDRSTDVSGRKEIRGYGEWTSEPSVGRMVYGVPNRVVHPPIRGLGNSVVPFVAELLGRLLIEADEDDNIS